MQKWQQKKRQKIHQSIIQNAKPTIRLLKVNSKSKQKMSTSRSKQFYKNAQNAQKTPNNPLLSFIKILQLFQLQKYQSILIKNGFPHKLKQKKSNKFIDQILYQVDEQDQQRFLSLMNTLIIMSKDIEKSIYSKNQFSRISKKQKIIRSPNLPPPPTGSQLRKSTNNFASSSKQTQKNNQFRVKNNLNQFKNNHIDSPYLYESTKYSLSNKKIIFRRSKQSKNNILNKNDQNYNKKPKKIKVKAFDDTFITHDFKNIKDGEPIKITKANKIIERLMDKLKSLNIDPKMHKEDINLSLQQIKKMYLSFDSVTLTSNIANIDLEQIIDCFVEQIFKKLDNNVDLSKTKNINNLLKRSKPISQFMNIENKEQIKYLLKQSLILPPSINQNMQFNPEKISSIMNKQIQGQRINTQELDINDQNREQNRKIILNSVLTDFNQNDEISMSIDQSIQQNDNQFYPVNERQSFFCDNFICFNVKMQESIQPIDKKDIKNFIQLVIMAGKMQKQIPIFANAYLKKLLNTNKLPHSKKKLTLMNWKNIILITLIEASKIWDDRSLQNHSFSKVLSTYTTYQINRLQKYFLYYIDYSLTINQKQYCQSYFQLRNNSKSASKTAHLMSLDLKKIQKLQNSIKSKQTQLKAYYRRKMDKSF